MVKLHLLNKFIHIKDLFFKKKLNKWCLTLMPYFFPNDH